MPALRQSLPQIADYPAHLEACWREHLAERGQDAPTVISTFAGAGGSSLGYSMAGFRELLAVEWDDNAVATFKANFHDVPVYHGDIAKLSVDKVFEMTGLKAGELDVFDGSPPCQGFSTAGKRMIDDPRNQLFREYVRLLRGLKPKVFVMENVSGMVKGKMKLLFVEILKELKASGYRVSARLLNAMYFGVPQSRERMIFVGVREDLGVEPSHPKACFTPSTVKMALRGANESDARAIPDWLKEACKIIPLYCWHGPKMMEIFKRVKGTSGGALSTKLLFWNKHSCTLLKNEIANSVIIHPSGERALSKNELSRLASFPDEFVFFDRASAIERIGNSVPPLFMRAIAKHIRAEILDKAGA